MKAGEDPRKDKHDGSQDGSKVTDPPTNSKPSPAPGGAGTGTTGDPAKSGDAGTGTGSDR